MTTYDKPKRKNTPAPAIINMLSSFVSGLFYYGLVAPVRWIWRQVGQVLGWSWHLMARFTNWVFRQIGSAIRGTWWLMSTLARNTILVPFIAVGRLLGFVPNAVPKGLSAQEAEVYQRINRQFRRKKRWYLHVISFLMGMVILWITQVFAHWAFPRVDVAVMFTLLWLLLLGTHRLWMNLGKSEDHEIGEALSRLRQTPQAVYYEEEIYEEAPYDRSRLTEADYDDAEWVDDAWVQESFKSKRQR